MDEQKVSRVSAVAAVQVMREQLNVALDRLVDLAANLAEVARERDELKRKLEGKDGSP